jgi:hypothetical protein
MAFTNISTTQLVFLHDYLRGNTRTLTSRQAASQFGILNLRARMSELRQMGLRVRREPSTTGYSKYAVSARDVWGSKASLTTR